MTDILIYGDIGPSYDWWDDTEDGITGESIANALAEVPTSETQVNIRINSVGGLCSEGFTIRNQLRTFSQRRKLFNPEFSLRSIIDGYAYSAAYTVALGGDKIVMNSGSMAMIHNCSGYMWGNAKDLRQAADYYDKIDSELATIIAMKSGKKKEDIQALLDGETFFTPEEAVAMGLADEIDTTVVTNYGKYGPTFSKLRSGKYSDAVRDYKQTCAKASKETLKRTHKQHKDLLDMDNANPDSEYNKWLANEETQLAIDKL